MMNLYWKYKKTCPKCKGKYIELVYGKFYFFGLRLFTGFKQCDCKAGYIIPKRITMLTTTTEPKVEF